MDSESSGIMIKEIVLQTPGLLISRYKYRDTCIGDTFGVSVSVSKILLEKCIESVSAILFEAKKQSIDTFCPIGRRDSIYCQGMEDSVRSNVLFLAACLVSLFGSQLNTELQSSSAVDRLFLLRCRLFTPLHCGHDCKKYR